jgi:hypothetical protein
MRSTLIGSLFVLSTVITAQDISPQRFKQLCETSLNNTVTIGNPVKILGSSALTVVNSGCVVDFSGSGKLEADRTIFRFAGPLVLDGVTKTEMTFVKSLWTAPSVQVVGGSEASFNVKESTFRAVSGNITVSLGGSSKIDAATPFTGQVNALEAAGNVRFTGGARAAFSFDRASVQSGGAFTMSFSGTDANLQVSGSEFDAEGGSLSITSSSTYANFDIKESTIHAASGITLQARGLEGKVSTQKVEMDSGTGATLIEASATTARKGSAKVQESNIVSGGGVIIRASRSSTEGEAVVEKSTISAGAALSVETGSGGTTTVVKNELSSPISIRASSGGSCTAEENNATAPIIRLCR